MRLAAGALLARSLAIWASTPPPRPCQTVAKSPPKFCQAPAKPLPSPCQAAAKPPQNLAST
eukprot:3589972-Karenia_brevis.AAC.1